MNLPSKLAYNPLFGDIIFVHSQKRLVFETRYFPWGRGGVSNPLYPTVATARSPF